MKGLLLKDLYMTVKYCWAYLLIVVVFTAVSFFATDQLFIFYPCLIVGLIPMNLLAYDERSKWTLYSGTLPYSKAQIVSGKYLIGLFAQLVVLVITGISQSIIMHRNGTFVLTAFLGLMALLLVTSCASSSLTLPIIFRWGVEKGRIAYAVVIGMGFAVSTMVAMRFGTGAALRITDPFPGAFAILCAVGLGIYALSWYLSIVFYRKREA